MKLPILAFTILVTLANVEVSNAGSWYQRIRDNILQYEKQIAFGGNLRLTAAEEAANAVLMAAKEEELKAGFEDPSSFPPAKNFLVAKDDIEKSKVFQIIRLLPKGAVLHTHSTAAVSLDYMFNNITYRPDLYACDTEKQLTLKFFSTPDETCKWELLSEIREDPTRGAAINQRIRQELTMAVENPDLVYPDIDKAWEKFNRIFKFIGPILSYKKAYVDHYYRALEELHEDNVMYFEVRSTLSGLYDLDGRMYGPKEFVDIYKEVTERFKRDHPDFFDAKLIYAPQRKVDHTRAQEYVKNILSLKKNFPEFVVGFDLVGQEDKGHPLKYFANELLAVDPNINFFFHAAETNWLGMSTDENLIDAILLNTRRIGHGYGLSFHPLILEVAKKLGIAVEVNPISNQVLGLVKDLRNHSARRLFTEDYPIVISNDDPGLWEAKGLSYDFYEAFMALMSKHSDLRALKLLAMNSIKYSALGEEQKGEAMKLWQKKWDEFVEKIASKKY